jgi:aryl-alcohol dehydrogenase-like predicted oxidoreductase
MKLLDVADADVCLLASQYSLIDHENALHHDFPAAHAKGVSFVVGSSLNATTTVRKTTRFRSRSSKSAKSCAR